MSEPRIIKKYPNRRLYDTEESRYITLADIRGLVLEKVNFVVIDKKSQKDITQSILLQVISEREQHGDPIFSRDFLSQIIRSYDGNMQGLVSNYMEQSLKLFRGQQQQIRARLKDVVGIDPVNIVSEIARKNLSFWKSAQEELFKTLSGGSTRHEAAEKKHEDKTG